MFWVAMAALLPSIRAPAQETPATFELSFSNPGARSLGLGGAFAALADDATAAFANPAGLVQLLRPEVSVEGRHWSYTTPYVEGGRFEGEPTGIGVDTVDGLRTAESEEDLNGVSYLSFVYPAGNWALALYRHQLARFRARTETQGLFHVSDEGDDLRALDRRWSTDLDIVSYGISGAYRIHERVSVGLGLTYFDGQLDAPWGRYFPDNHSIEAFFGPNSYLPERQYTADIMAIDDSDWGINAGVLWSLTGQWRVGGFYRLGPEFTAEFDTYVGPALADVDPDFPLAAGDLALRVATPISFPDVYGLAVAFRSADGRLALGFEWDRVEYSTIFESFDPTVVETIDPDLDLSVQLAADDGDELHLGGEYAFLDASPVIAVRVGAWLDPDHRFHSTRSGSTDDDLQHRALFPRGEDEIHISMGVGLAFTHLQVDLGVDFSDLVDTASLSVIYSF